MKRTMISMLAIAGLISLGFSPLPSGVSTSARIIPRSESPIYVTTPGRLQTVKKLPGEQVSEGEEIACLENPDVELRYLTTRGRYETQLQIVESIRRSALNTPEAANDLPGQEAFLSDLRQQLEAHESRRNGLVIRAPASGTLIVAPRRSEQKGHEYELVRWSGYPTDQQNQGCFMEAGHELMSVSRDKNWNAELILDQFEIQRVRVGASVRLALRGMPEKTFTGTVVEISCAEWTAEGNAQRHDDPAAARRNAPPATSYVVLVELEPLEIPMVSGALAQSRIEAPSISAFGRASRMLNGLLRFR